MKRGVLLKFCLLLFWTRAWTTELATVSFDRSQLTADDYSRAIHYGSLPLAPTMFSASIAFHEAYVEFVGTESIGDISCIPSSSEVFPVNFAVGPFEDVATSETGAYRFADLSSASNLLLGQNAMVVEGEIRIGLRRYAKIVVFPVHVENSTFVFNHEISVRVGDRAIDPAALLTADDIAHIREASAKEVRSPNQSGSDNKRYVIITADSLMPACLSLVSHKLSLGMAIGLESIGTILATYAGVDDAEKLRNFLKFFYSQGGEYVLLVGDESILPIRHAYHIDVTAPVSIDHQLLCDLYFADLTGDWDSDGDGVFGERTHDHADLVPELKVGRLPVSTASEIERYTRNLIIYETNPGNGNFDYLNRAVFFSSDEMRDYGIIGQHGLISRAYPAQFVIDTTALVEATSGADPAPTNIGGSAVNDTLASGYGIVNIIAHGRYDGFAVKTATYNAWPKSLYLADPLSWSHTDASTLQPNGNVGFYYSLSCDVGGFDENLPPLNLASTNFVQRMLTLDSAGAVGFVGYSRWGWVASSYLLQKAFFDSLFADPGRPAIEAMYASQAGYSYLRDLVYGQNYFGDPTVTVYAVRPKKIAAHLDQTIEGLRISASIEGNPAKQALVRLVKDTALLGEYHLNDEGIATIDYPFNLGEDYVVTLSYAGAVTSSKQYRPGLGAGVDDDEAITIPKTLSLSQNYPNPFNPTTTIEFELPYRSHVSLTIVNVLGETVKTLSHDEFAAGRYSLEWNGTNTAGGLVSSGIYYYKLIADSFQQTKKMILLK